MNELMKKLTSGRFILTVACAIAFVYCVFTKELPNAAVAAILTSVFKDYFNKREDNGSNPTS